MLSLSTFLLTLVLAPTALSASIVKRTPQNPDCSTNKCMSSDHCGSNGGDWYAYLDHGICHCINNYTPVATSSFAASHGQYKYWLCMEDCSVNPNPDRPWYGCGCPVIGQWSAWDPVSRKYTCQPECNGTGTNLVCGCEYGKAPLKDPNTGKVTCGPQGVCNGAMNANCFCPWGTNQVMNTTGNWNCV